MNFEIRNSKQPIQSPLHPLIPMGPGLQSKIYCCNVAQDEAENGGLQPLMTQVRRLNFKHGNYNCSGTIYVAFTLRTGEE